MLSPSAVYTIFPTRERGERNDVMTRDIFSLFI